MPETGGDSPRSRRMAVRRVLFTNIRSPLRQVLLANQLFLVITDTKKFLDACSVRFQLTALSFARLRAEGTVTQDAINKAQPMQGYTYENQSYFDAALEAVTCGQATGDSSKFRAGGGGG